MFESFKILATLSISIGTLYVIQEGFIGTKSSALSSYLLSKSYFGPIKATITICPISTGNILLHYGLKLNVQAVG